jgi:hypothetical protein
MKRILRNGVALALFISGAIGCNKEVIDSTTNEAAVSNTTVSTKALAIETAAYYIAPNGNDANPGTLAKPFKTWGKILNLVKPGDLVYLRGGTYPAVNDNHAVYLKGKNGAEGNYIRFWAYPGETPILDCSTMKVINYLSGVDFNGNYWHFKGLEIKGLPQPKNSAGAGYFCVAFSAQECNNCIFENINCHNNQGMGFYLGGNSNNNQIINCDSHDNYDPYSFDSSGKLYDGGNADGFHITLSNKNTTNTFTGCRAWSNSDDGYDCWSTEGVLKFDKCWSFSNGYLPGTTTPKGDGNGFKFGITYLTADGTYHRVVTNCLSFNNRGMGFDQNNAACMILLENNTAYRNCQFGFYFDFGNIKHKLKNNIAIENSLSRSNKTLQVGLESYTDNTNNSWNGISTSANPFLSISTNGMFNARNSDGSLPSSDFLKLSLTSVYIDKGIDVGIAFLGKAPDVGAYEAR